MVENKGNTSEIYTLRPKADQGLSFKPEQERLKVAPGESGTAEFTISTRRGLLIASHLAETFSIDIITQIRTDTLSGQVASRGILGPRWIFGALLAVALFMCAVLSLWVAVGYLPGGPSAPTPNPVIITARAATFEATSSDSATATAQWWADDSDGDSLSNSQEIELYHTDPFKKDTDGDTLPDNIEILQMGTNPTLPDSDFDTLPDNVEVSKLSTPTNPDSDFDGTPDALDPDPVQAPTITPVNTLVPTATLTPHAIGFSDPQPFLTPLSFFGSQQRYQIDEDEGPAVIEVQLSPPASRQVQVNYAVEVSNAIAGQDYRLPGNGVLVFNPPSSRQTFPVEILNNPARTGDKRLILVLRGQSPGVQLGLERIELVIRDTTP
jgi:hypothetical protein